MDRLTLGLIYLLSLWGIRILERQFVCFIQDGRHFSWVYLITDGWQFFLCVVMTLVCYPVAFLVVTRRQWLANALGCSVLATMINYAAVAPHLSQHPALAYTVPRACVEWFLLGAGVAVVLQYVSELWQRHGLKSSFGLPVPIDNVQQGKHG